MSYAVLAFILSLIFGFFGTLFLVFGNAGKRHANRIVWGSLVFLALVWILALLTTGWSSALASVIGGSLIFAIEGDTLGSISFTYGRVLVELADSDSLYRTRWASPLNRAGQRLQDWERSLVGRSVLGWCVRNAYQAFYHYRKRQRKNR
jgi:hypothetical protein